MVPKLKLLVNSIMGILSIHLIYSHSQMLQLWSITKFELYFEHRFDVVVI
jgi:hypothetical protein